MGKTVHGLPPWEGSPTPPLEVYREAAAADAALFWRMSSGHHLNLLEMACDQLDAERTERQRWEQAANALAQQVAELQEVAAAAERRRATKQAYQADYRDGLRGNRAARAAQRAGLS